MQSLLTLGFAAVACGCGWLAWKVFEIDYQRLKKIGGPEWVRIERLTVLSVIAAALGGGTLVTLALIWLEGR